VLQELGRAIARDPRGDNGILVSSGPPATHEATARTSDLLTEAVELPPLALAEALEIDLEGLDGALARHSPDRVRELKTKLHAECGGHPLFYVRGLLDLAGNGEESLRLAPTERVRNLLTGLSRDEVAWAAALAVLGRPAAVEDVQALAGARAGRSALERLRSRGLLAGDDGALRLAHPSLAAAVLEGLSAAERCEIQLGAAELMARRARTSSGALLESAGHFIDAGERARGLTAALEWLEGPAIVRPTCVKRDRASSGDAPRLPRPTRRTLSAKRRVTSLSGSAGSTSARKCGRDSSMAPRMLRAAPWRGSEAGRRCMRSAGAASSAPRSIARGSWTLL
jgi:hypothetical protein